MDVTTKFETVLFQNLAIYILLDINIACTIWMYVKSIRDRRYNPDYTYTFCFIVFFIFFGVVELIMLMALRLSKPGRICSGDYLEDNDPNYNDHTDYFMKNEGLFVYIWFGYVSFSALAFALLVFKVNNQKFYRDQIDQAYIAPSVIQDHSRAAQIILNQIKFVPEIKYPTIQEMYDIKENYNLVEELGTGIHGKTWIANKADYDAVDSDGNSKGKCVIKSIEKKIMDKQELPDKLLKQITLI